VSLVSSEREGFGGAFSIQEQRQDESKDETREKNDMEFI
jgi:hypothetical protein